MKLRSFLLLLTCLLTWTLQAQDEVACLPDTTIIDSAGAIFPRPFLPDDSLGIGITKVACINEPFEFVFTIVIPSSVDLAGFSIPLTGARAETTGAVDSLPIGLTYECNPGDCQYNILEPSCLVLRGTPSPENDTGVYNLTLNFVLLTNIGSVGVTFPGAQFPGNYFLKLMPEGSSECGQILANRSQSSSSIDIYNAPNPFKESTTLYLHLQKPENMQLRISDMTGRILRDIPVHLQTGPNILPLNDLDLVPGMYTYTLYNQSEQVSRKMMVY